MDEMTMFEAAEEMLAMGDWAWDGDEIVWDPTPQNDDAKSAGEE